MTTITSKRIKEVLKFWFGSPEDPNYLSSKSFWYGSTEEDDQIVRKALADDYQKARNGEFDHWIEAGGDGALALIILLDQVPRNIFRNTPEAYATDSKALEFAKIAVDKGWDKGMPNIQRRYIYSPFNHSENLEIQKRSVQLFTELGDSQHLFWAKSFYDTIKKYGRFPHRDLILGRK
jgi:uncharacterized protein (DUF924 family)